jgi:hypothetical protein
VTVVYRPAYYYYSYTYNGLIYVGAYYGYSNTTVSTRSIIIPIVIVGSLLLLFVLFIILAKCTGKNCCEIIACLVCCQCLCSGESSRHEVYYHEE